MRSGGIGRCDLDLPVLMGFFEMICLGGIYGILSEREVHAKILRDGMVFRWDSPYLSFKIYSFYGWDDLITFLIALQ